MSSHDEYRSVPVRTVRPTHDGRVHTSNTPAVAEADDVSNGSGRGGSQAWSTQPAVASPVDRTTGPADSHRYQPTNDVSHATNISPSRRQSATRRTATTPQRAAPMHPIINLENFEAHLASVQLKTVFNSPRSLAVCAAHGIHGTELLPRPPQSFLAPNVPESIAAMRYHHFESRRQEKLAMLRSSRADYIHQLNSHPPQPADHQGSEAPVPPQASSRPQTPRPRSAGPVRPVSAVITSVNGVGAAARPQLGVKPTTASTRRQDPTAVLERAAKRELVYERAIKLRLEREQRVIQTQILAEQRATAHRRACEEEKLRVIELRRLKWSDAREDIEHKQRQQDYVERQRRGSSTDSRRAASTERATHSFHVSSRPSSPRQRVWDVQLAKESYFTPRQRAEKAAAAQPSLLPQQ